MFRSWLPRFTVRCFTLVVASVLFASSASAGLERDDSMLSLHGGYAFAWADEVAGSVTGWTANGWYERMAFNGDYALGVWAGYMTIGWGQESSNNPVEANFASVPAVITLKYFLGDSESSAVGYGGGGLGLHYSHFNGATNDFASDESRVGIAGTLHLGGMFFMGEKLFLDANYTLLWLTNTFYSKNFANTINVGIGLRLSD